MGQMEMREQDLLELYQLLELYRRTYGVSAGKEVEECLEKVRERYGCRTGGGDIGKARNPRGAGRKAKYRAEENHAIFELYKSGKSLRQIAKEAACSVGHVQDVIKRNLKKS